MGDVRLAFRRSSGGVLARLIRWRTNGKRWHVELVLPADGALLPLDVCFSAMPISGTRFAVLDLSNSDEWEIVSVDGVDPVKAYASCLRHSAKRYDWRSILRYLCGVAKDARLDHWYCSEVCLAVLQEQGVFTWMDGASTSPEDLWIAAKAREHANK